MSSGVWVIVVGCALGGVGLLRHVIFSRGRHEAPRQHLVTRATLSDVQLPVTAALDLASTRVTRPTSIVSDRDVIRCVDPVEYLKPLLYGNSRAERRLVRSYRKHGWLLSVRRTPRRVTDRLHRRLLRERDVSEGTS